MRIDLNLPPGEKQRQFLDYFNANLRRLASSAYGSARFDEAGNFRAATTGAFALESGAAQLQITAITKPDRVLTHVEIEPTEPQSSDRWKEEAHRVISSALAATIAERQQKFFHRAEFYYVGPGLDGEYWLPGFRVAPLLPQDADPNVINAERLLEIDFVVDAIDRMHAWMVADQRARRHAARLGLVANVGLYPQQHESVWVTPNGEGAKSERLHRGLLNGGVRITEMPEKGAICNLGTFEGSVTDKGRQSSTLKLPIETRRILRAVENAAASVQEGFDRCARLMQVAWVCGKYFPSAGLAYRVAAVEAVANALVPQMSFSQFIRAHVPMRPETDAILDYLYGSVRSSHFHAGQFPLGEFDRRLVAHPLLNADDMTRFDQQHTAYALVDEALSAWMLVLSSGPDA